jgi:hypothetical protein
VVVVLLGGMVVVLDVVLDVVLVAVGAIHLLGHKVQGNTELGPQGLYGMIFSTCFMKISQFKMAAMRSHDPIIMGNVSKLHFSHSPTTCTS